MNEQKAKPLTARDIEVGARYRHTQYHNTVYLGCGTQKPNGLWHKKHLIIIEDECAKAGCVVNLAKNPNWSTCFVKL